ncbi:MAG: hypothetical protein QG585_360 [Patescibacteria group bacterium]|jgi:hypothetical protein|nr:hypothetical protein [Patescibacteria group bacterium]
MAKKTFDPTAVITTGTNIRLLGYRTNWLTPQPMAILEALPKAHRFVTGKKPETPVHSSDFTLVERNGRHLTFEVNI